MTESIVAVDLGIFAGWLQRLLLVLIKSIDKLRPPRVFGQFRAFGKNFFTEFFNAPFLDEEFDARAAAHLLFTVATEDSGNCLRDRQQFFRRHELVEDFGLSRDSPQTSADNNFESSRFDTVDCADFGGHAQIVHLSQPARVLMAAAEGRLEFTSKVLSIRVSEQELSQCPSVGGDIEGLIFADTHEGAAGDVAD